MRELRERIQRERQQLQDLETQLALRKSFATSSTTPLSHSTPPSSMQRFSPVLLPGSSDTPRTLDLANGPNASRDQSPIHAFGRLFPCCVHVLLLLY